MQKTKIAKKSKFMHVPFLRPDIRASDLARMTRSIKSGWLVVGPETRLLEEKLAAYFGVKDAVMTNSATAALHLSLILAGVKAGDEVITTALSYVATSNVILHQNAVPVFVDVDPKTGLIDLDQVEAKISTKTKAVMPVHMYGQMVDMKRLSKMTKELGIPIVEDSAHAIEARRDGVRPGELGFSSCLSFHAAKNITSGQGGALIINNLELGKEARMLRRDGVVNIDHKRTMLNLGHKYDSTDFQAALLIGQLDRISETHKKRLAVYERYAKAFTKAGVSFPETEKGVIHAAHMFVIFVDPKRRDEIRLKLAERGVETSIHYHAIPLEPYYEKKFGFKHGDFPHAERIGDSVITLPTYGGLKPTEQRYVIDSVLSLL